MDEGTSRARWATADSARSIATSTMISVVGIDRVRRWFELTLSKIWVFKNRKLGFFINFNNKSLQKKCVDSPLSGDEATEETYEPSPKKRFDILPLQKNFELLCKNLCSDRHCE
ncbi:Uncharacterized protein Fot_18508 [Forsythia ovata]|uniref:Uncharacterized protein n=1 Tax=Forsythia ovata TaxID=205694 RepID=A0ABD1VID2_9LAMI